MSSYLWRVALRRWYWEFYCTRSPAALLITGEVKDLGPPPGKDDVWHFQDGTSATSNEIQSISCAIWEGGYELKNNPDCMLEELSWHHWTRKQKLHHIYINSWGVEKR